MGIYAGVRLQHFAVHKSFVAEVAVLPAVLLHVFQFVYEKFYLSLQLLHLSIVLFLEFSHLFLPLVVALLDC